MIGQNEREAIHTKLNSLAKREVFGPVVQTPEGVTNVYLCENKMRKMKS
jgi:hypothetical protein